MATFFMLGLCKCAFLIFSTIHCHARRHLSRATNSFWFQHRIIEPFKSFDGFWASYADGSLSTRTENQILITFIQKAVLTSIRHSWHLSGLHKLIKVRQIGGNFQMWHCGCRKAPQTPEETLSKTSNLLEGSSCVNLIQEDELTIFWRHFHA